MIIMTTMLSCLVSFHFPLLLFAYKKRKSPGIRMTGIPVSPVSFLSQPLAHLSQAVSIASADKGTDEAGGRETWVSERREGHEKADPNQMRQQTMDEDRLQPAVIIDDAHHVIPFFALRTNSSQSGAYPGDCSSLVCKQWAAVPAGAGK
jgi:hypothetical protein